MEYEYVIGVLISYAVDVGRRDVGPGCVRACCVSRLRWPIPLALEVDFKTPPGLRSTTVMTRRLATMFQCLGDR